VLEIAYIDNPWDSMSNKHQSLFLSTNGREKPLYMYALEATEKGALACFPWIGRGDVMAADQAAVNGMRSAFEAIPVSGKIIIGEGERDEAPMLYIGEAVGAGGPDVDIAVDPLEGTNICAEGLRNSLSVLAMAPQGSMLHAPDVYMQKIVTGPGVQFDATDLDFSVKQNIGNAADSLKIKIEDMIITVLNRPRHQQLINDIKEAGAKINLIEDGDILASIACSLDHMPTHMYMGTGGAPEGVLAAAALKCLGGNIKSRLLLPEDQHARALAMGIADVNRKYSIIDMVSDEVIFVATGVTSGDLVDGVSMLHGMFTTHSIVLRSNVPEILRLTRHHT